MLLATGSAFAQYARSEGVFVSPQLTVRTVLLDRSQGVAAASITVAMDGCSGSIAGMGSLANRQLSFSSYEKTPGGAFCKVSITFDREWKKVQVSDNGQCTAFHGAACSWDQQTATRLKEP
ncbi:MAG TPA: hypothetical protein VIN03_21215 [Roseateles sp.]